MFILIASVTFFSINPTLLEILRCSLLLLFFFRDFPRSIVETIDPRRQLKTLKKKDSQSFVELEAMFLLICNQAWS